MKKFASKLGLVAASVFAFANSAMAAITVGADGTVSGDIDVTPVMTVVGIIATALALLITGKWVLSFLRRA